MVIMIVSLVNKGCMKTSDLHDKLVIVFSAGL